MPKTEMLINYVPGEECRIAIAQDGRLEEFYQERASTESHVGNIYKGRVTNVEPSIQAAFVDFGLERNGFLHISDLHPMYFPGKDREEFEQVGSKTPHRERPPIQRCLRRGQEILVQVLKEGIGTKGPTLTSYLSIPGRFLVMMPYMQKLGVSRKVEDDDARRESRKLLAELNPPDGFGFIVRTAGIGQTKTDFKRDLAYLQRLWKSIEQRRKQIGRVGELYTESDLIIRTIRDVFSTDIHRIVVDDPTAAKRAHDFLSIASPRSRSKVVYYNDPVPLFHRFDIERQIESIHSREVLLPSGGSLVIDQTEALVAIDVNSGKSRDARDAESNAFNTDKEAVDEIARQLRLRDLGGVIVLDLIDMRDPKHRRQIEQRFRSLLKKDRARTRIGAISQFGLLEMTRQRMRPSFKTSVYVPCDSCTGTGHVKSPESVVLDVMRRLALAMQHESVQRIELTISPDVAFQLLNRKRAELVKLETRHNKPVMVRVGGATVDHVHIAAYDERGVVDLESLSSPKRLPPTRDETFVELEGGELPPDLEVEDEVEPVAVAATAGQADAADATEAQSEARDKDKVEDKAEAEAKDQEGGEEGGGGRRRRRRRRRRRGRKGGSDGNGGEGAQTSSVGAEASDESKSSDERDKDDVKAEAEASSDDRDGDGGDDNGDGEGGGKSRRRRRHRRGDRGRSRKSGDADKAGQSEQTTSDSGNGGGGDKSGSKADSDSNGNATAPPAQRKDEKQTVTTGGGYSNRLLETDSSGKNE